MNWHFYIMYMDLNGLIINLFKEHVSYIFVIRAKCATSEHTLWKNEGKWSH